MDATRQIEAENSLINSFAKIRKITEKNELFKYYLHGKYKLFSRLQNTEKQRLLSSV
jgi:hypothetical protein